jgi:ABC-type amino acid transport substrate-binding protein
MLSKKQNILFFSLSKTKFRENKYTWLGQVMSKKWQVYALKTSALAIDNFEQLKRLSILGVVRGDVREEWLVNHKFTNLHSVTNHKQNILRVLKRRIPAFIYEEQGLLHMCKELNIDASLFKVIHTVNTAPVYIVMSKNSASDILALWERAFNKLLANGEILKISRYWQSKLQDEFMISSDISNNILVF